MGGRDKHILSQFFFSFFFVNFDFDCGFGCEVWLCFCLVLSQFRVVFGVGSGYWEASHLLGWEDDLACTMCEFVSHKLQILTAARAKVFIPRLGDLLTQNLNEPMVSAWQSGVGIHPV